MNRRLRFTLVLLLYALMFVCSAANAYLTFSSSYKTSASGWLISREDTRFVVEHVSPYGPTDQLRKGDEVIALNGQQVRSRLNKSNFFKAAELGKSYTLTVRRDGQMLELSLRTVSVSTPVWLGIFVVAVLSPTIFLIVGFSLFLLKPDDKQALLLSLVFAMLGLSTSAFFLAPDWLQLLMSIGSVISGLMFPLFLHFCLIFPEPSRVFYKIPRVQMLLYIPALLLILPSLALENYAAIAAPQWVGSPLVTLIVRAATIVRLAYIIGGLLLLVLKYRHASQVSRRKLRVLLAGTILGTLPVLSVEAAQLFLPASTIYRATSEWHLLIVPLAGILAPLSFAYAIARHKVIPVSLIIRRSIQYLLARNALRLLLILPLAGILLTILLNPNRTLAEILFRNSIYFYVLVIAADLLGLMYRRRLTEWIDRKFFRESYNQGKILSELVEDVKRADSMAEMSRLVSHKVDSALHPEHIYLFYREEDRRDLSLGYSSGVTSSDLRIPSEFRLLRFMEDQGSAQDFPFPEKNNLPQEEKDWLAQLGTRLVVPMTGTDGRLAGLFLLGEKKAEIPYTARDRELLETLADQIAIVHENIHLKERAHRERKIKREVLERFEGQDINLLKECPACGACYDSVVELCAKDRSELTLSLPVERTIEARYRLDQLIGKGGMGAVYQARDLRLDRQVAVKILSGQLFGDRAALRRFEREAQASARLNHPNIVTVYDYGALHTEGAYLVMEILRGETLRQMLKRDGRIHPQAAAELFDQVLNAVRAAHDAGVIHRDLKPENILLSEAGDGRKVVRVLDFGLAKIVQQNVSDMNSPTAPMVTSPGTVMGTFGYMSPEQLMGTAVDERSDIFSIGVIVVEALTGKRPFTGKTHHELLINILQEPFHLEDESLEAQRLDRILQKCLMKESAGRFSSAIDLQRELIPALRACPALTSHIPTAAREADTFIKK